jgi:hypothetical protein
MVAFNDHLLFGDMLLGSRNVLIEDARKSCTR